MLASSNTRLTWTRVGEHFELYSESATGHCGLVTTRTWRADAVLQTFSAREYLNTPTYLSVQVGEGTHVHLTPEFLQYINHSCDPNTHIDTTAGRIVCLRDIEAGEEITFFYPSTEWSMARPFKCSCQAQNCLGTIKGATDLDDAILDRYRLADHIAAQRKRMRWNGRGPGCSMPRQGT